MADVESLIGRLEDASDSDVLVLASHWTRLERSYDFDAAAARIVIDALSNLAEGDCTDTLTLFAAGRGGHPGFSQTVLRVARAHWPNLRLYIPYFSSGFVTLLAFDADEVILHPYAALGAVDDGNVSALESREEGQDFGPVEGPTTDAWRRLARQVASRVLARQDLEVDTEIFAHDSLGREVGFGAADLDEMGFPMVDADYGDAAWQLFAALEDELGFTQQLAPRYTKSDIGTEVEFEMATGLDAAAIQTRLDAYRYVMDTGRPHPDTGVYDGEWSKVDSRSKL